MENQPTFQEQFFRTLRQRYGAEKTVQLVKETLCLSKAAVYKRMNGKTNLTANELALLTERFQVSLDTILQNPKRVSFFHPFREQRSGTSFLDGFSYYLKPTVQDDWSELTYLANELPVFYYLSYEHSFHFLMTIWNHLHWGNCTLKISRNNKIEPKLKSLSKDIAAYYDAQSVTEIWNSNMFANLYQQILFSISIQAFLEKEDIDNLLYDINRLIKDLKKIATTGEFTSSLQVVPSQVYLNEFGNYLNMVIFNSDRIQATFVGYDIPHFIVTHDHHFYQFSQQWVEKLKNALYSLAAKAISIAKLFLAN